MTTHSVLQLNSATDLHAKCMNCKTAWGLVTPSKLPVQITPHGKPGRQIMLCGKCYDEFVASPRGRALAGKVNILDGRQLALEYC